MAFWVGQAVMHGHLLTITKLPYVMLRCHWLNWNRFSTNQPIFSIMLVYFVKMSAGSYLSQVQCSKSITDDSLCISHTQYWIATPSRKMTLLESGAELSAPKSEKTTGQSSSIQQQYTFVIAVCGLVESYLAQRCGISYLDPVIIIEMWLSGPSTPTLRCGLSYLDPVVSYQSLCSRRRAWSPV